MGFSASDMFGKLKDAFTGHGSGGLPGAPVILSAEGQVSPIQSATGASAAAGTVTAATIAPPPTIVGASGGLQINLIWDASVGALIGSALTSFETAVITAAQFYTTMYSSPEMINIQVGFGEVAGQTLPSGALAASESYGYLERYASVAAGLKRDSGWSGVQASADRTLPTTDPTHGGSFFVSTAEAKAMGQVSGYSTAIDGFIGLSSSYPFTFDPNARAVAGQYDAIGAIEHEISEVMGRVGSLGSAFGRGIYTPLDLFRYYSPGRRDLVPATGYFSVNGGTTNLGTYNNPRTGGDTSDWASSLRGDSYGFGSTGTAALVSANDIIENSALGYHMTAAGLFAAHTTGVA